jgi:hypothetical protein
MKSIFERIKNFFVDAIVFITTPSVAMAIFWIVFTLFILGDSSCKSSCKIHISIN